ncbi:MAG TPA: STAS domain-containing protein [Gaiellales bacterium]
MQTERSAAGREVGTVKVEFASPETALVTLVGEHDLNSRLALRATLMNAAEGRDLLVDLGQCTFADSAIVSLLLGTERTLAGRDRRCDLIIPTDSGYVTRLFEITGIAELFRVHATLEAALASLAEPRELASGGSR